MAGEQGIVPRMLPGLDKDNRPFWTGGAEGKLLICRCGDCGHYIHPPRPKCGACGSRDVAPTAVSGRARVKAFTVNYQPWVPRVPVPYVFAAVELEEQTELYVLTNIVGCDPEEVYAGMPVEVVFEAQEDVHVPLFQPRSAG
jgi:uncharacterized OB-fold protein